MTFIADWMEGQRGGDPAKEWRGRYRTAIGAARIVRRHGGMTGLVDCAVGGIGMDRTVTARRGDVAVVQTPEGDMGAIVTGAGVATFGGAGIGLIVRPLPILAAWRV